MKNEAAYNFSTFLRDTSELVKMAARTDSLNLIAWDEIEAEVTEYVGTLDTEIEESVDNVTLDAEEEFYTDEYDEP